jgi:NADPH2:quinone reductase
VRAALLTELGATPHLVDAEIPRPRPGEQLIEIEAAGMNPVDVNISRGLAFDPPLPCTPGMEGIGRTADGRRVYFDSARQPFGSFAQFCVVADDEVMEVPDSIDEATAMPFGIAGLAAWTGLTWKGALRENETVLILGASSIVGQIGVQLAARLGAGRVVAAARDEAFLARAAALGADATVRLGGTRHDQAAELQEASRGGFDLVLDMLWGEPLEAAAATVAPFGRIVQIGASAGPTAEIPARPLRTAGISILTHINYHAPVQVRAAGFARMCMMAAAGQLVVPVEEAPLEHIADIWKRQQTGPHVKLVIRPPGIGAGRTPSSALARRDPST